MDPCPAVRVIAVIGICRISNLFWELIPAHTLQAFMTKLVQEIVFDASSSNVRAAVFQVRPRCMNDSRESIVTTDNSKELLRLYCHL